MAAAFILPLHTPILRRTSHSAHTGYIKRPQTLAPICQRVSPNTSSAPSPASLRPLTGEWAGYEASFNPSGEIIPIPDYYIPEEFREWGIIPSGFECHTSINATETHIHKKHLRVLPSVSHFGDHVAVEEEALSVDMTDAGVVVFEDGCWISGKEVVNVKKGKLEKWPIVEMFMRNKGRGCGIRVRFNREDGCVVDDVRVIMQDWVGEYADLGVMEGGSGYVSGWVDRGGLIDVDGVWKTKNGESIEESGGVLLPGGVDVGARLVDGGCLLWTGWTVDEERLVLRRYYDDDGKLVYSERLVLRRE